MLCISVSDYVNGNSNSNKQWGYVSSTGKTRNTKKFTDEMNAFYANMWINAAVNVSQTQTVLVGCVIAF